MKQCRDRAPACFADSILTIPRALYWTFLLLAVTAIGQEIHVDRFNQYPPGSDGSPTWRPIKGLWQVRDGQYVQESQGYDHATLFPRLLDQTYSLTLRFRQTSSEAGAGVFFSSSTAAHTQFAHMLRLDGPARLMAGYFERGEYQVQKIFSVDLDTLAWHHLELRIDQARRRYQIRLNHTIVGEAELLFPVGFVGLQSSGGPIMFDDFVLTVSESENARLPVYWPEDLAVDGSGQLVLSDPYGNRLIRLEPSGELIEAWSVGVANGGIIHELRRVLPLTDGALVLFDAATTTLHRFSDRTWGHAFGGRGMLSDVTDVVGVPGKNWILVLESEGRRVHILDQKLMPVSVRPFNGIARAVALAASDSSFSILDGGQSRICAYRLQEGTVDPFRIISIPSGLAQDFVVRGHQSYVIVDHDVLKLDQHGRILARFAAQALGLFRPKALALGPENQLFVADFSGSRIVRVDSSLTDPHIAVAFNPESGLLTWTSTKTARGQLRLRDKTGTILGRQGQAAARDHQMTLPALAPASIHYASVYPTLATIPADSNWSRNKTILVPAGNGQKPIKRIQAICLIFKNIEPSAQGLDQEAVAEIKLQLTEGARFFWIHSGFNLWVDLSFLEISDRLQRSDLFEDKWYYPPREEVIRNTLERAGKSPADYPVQFVLAAVMEQKISGDSWELAGRGGAFTNGFGANHEFGLSWWEITASGHAAGNNWLMVHEFSHQLDELFNLSGYPEFWFNHFAPKLGNVGPFGEHFDGNAFLLHRIPTPWWHDLFLGDRIFVADRDGDGIPDQDPRLPLDEATLGSSPEARDTDRDGVDDLDEVLFANWIERGHGEHYGGARIMPDLGNRDADGDGIPDDEDSNPLNAFSASFEYDTPVLDGILARNEWGTFFNFDDPRGKAEIAGLWDSSAVYFAIRMPAPTSFKIQMDGNLDGWFAGRDNWLLQFTWQDGRLGLKRTLFDASSYETWPRTVSNGPWIPVRFAQDSSAEGLSVEIAVAREDLFAGGGVGSDAFHLNMGLAPVTHSGSGGPFISLAEPNRFLRARLNRN